MMASKPALKPRSLLLGTIAADILLFLSAGLLVIALKGYWEVLS